MQSRVGIKHYLLIINMTTGHLINGKIKIRLNNSSLGDLQGRRGNTIG